MGHATFPNQMRNKEAVFSMLKGFGGELYEIARSEQGKTVSSSRPYQNNAYDIMDVGSRIESMLYTPQPQQQQMGAYVPPQPQVNNRPTKNTVKIDYMNDDISKYIGGSTSASMGETTTTTVDFSTAVKPLVAKAEMICQLLGKIYQIEQDTNVTVKGLGAEIANSISANFETYLAAQQGDIGISPMDDEEEV